MHRTARCLPTLTIVALVSVLLGTGCTRKHFRERADKDVEGVITQKNVFPEWEVKNWHAYPNPEARFADATNPDRPPYPPDDYAARIMSPNPQKPTKKSGVGRVDGTGYVSMLERWDTQNRAEDPTPPARGAAASQFFPPQTAQAATARPLPPQPAKPQPVADDRPAVRHALPPGFPGAVVTPASGTQTASAAPPAKPSGVEFGPWVAARPSMPGPVVATKPNGAPTITELRPPIVMVAVGETELNGKTVPAIALVPVPGVPLQPPAVQPPERVPEPKPVPPDPAAKPEPKDGNPVGQVPAPGSGVPGTLVLAGDGAAEYVRALESGEVGYRLKLEQAVELGVFNAREFQDRREDLYLAASRDQRTVQLRVAGVLHPRGDPAVYRPRAHR